MSLNNSTISHDKIGISAALLTATGWGLAGIFIQLITDIPALYIISMRLFIALVVVIPTLLLLKRDLVPELALLKKPIVWGLSGILFLCYTLGTTSFQMAPVGEATLLMTTAPLFVILYRVIVNDRVNTLEYIGAFFSILGIIFIMWPNLSSSMGSTYNDERLIGGFLALTVSVLFSINAIWYSSLSKKGEAPSTLSVSLMTLIIGSFAFIVFLPNLPDLAGRLIDYKVIIAIILLSIMSTAIPTISYAVAAKRLPALMTTSVLLLEPVLAVIFAFLILNEVPSEWLLPGLILILIGLYFIAKGSLVSQKAAA